MPKQEVMSEVGFKAFEAELEKSPAILIPTVSPRLVRKSEAGKRGATAKLARMMAGIEMQKKVKPIRHWYDAYVRAQNAAALAMSNE